MKLHLLAAALFLLGIVCLAQQSSAQLTMTGVGGGFGGSSAPVRAYSYKYKGTTNTSGGAASFTSVPIGTASATRLVIAALLLQNGLSGLTTFTCGGVNFTQASGSADPSGTGAFYSANVTTGTTCTIAITQTSGPSLDVDVIVWSADGLASNTANKTCATAGLTCTISSGLLNGDFLFAENSSGGGNFSGSTQTTTGANDRSVTGANGNILDAADWTNASGAAFNFTAQGFSDIGAATWR